GLTRALSRGKKKSGKLNWNDKSQGFSNFPAESRRFLLKVPFPAARYRLARVEVSETGRDAAGVLWKCVVVVVGVEGGEEVSAKNVCR
ncbi:hypothetical protein CEXT_398961, partial [Caerostris extrusa]